MKTHKFQHWLGPPHSHLDSVVLTCVDYTGPITRTWFSSRSPGFARLDPFIQASTQSHFLEWPCWSPHLKESLFLRVTITPLHFLHSIYYHLKWPDYWLLVSLLHGNINLLKIPTLSVSFTTATQASRIIPGRWWTFHEYFLHALTLLTSLSCLHKSRAGAFGLVPCLPNRFVNLDGKKCACLFSQTPNWIQTVVALRVHVTLSSIEIIEIFISYYIVSDISKYCLFSSLFKIRLIAKLISNTLIKKYIKYYFKHFF